MKYINNARLIDVLRRPDFHEDSKFYVEHSREIALIAADRLEQLTLLVRLPPTPNDKEKYL